MYTVNGLPWHSQSVAFVPKYDTDVPWSLQNNANAWYCNKGHCLTSEPIDTDDSLRKRLRSALGGSAATATGGLEIQLYLVAPATPAPRFRFSMGVHVEEERQTYVSSNQRAHWAARGVWYGFNGYHDGDNSILTRMAALFEPAFAYAQNALWGLQDTTPLGEGENCEEEGNAGSVGAVVDATGLSGKDDVLDAHLFMAQLRDTFNGLKMGFSESESKQGAFTHGVALSKVLQLLFDDPTLDAWVQVSMNHLPRIEIEAECPTPCGIPALYVFANDRLTSLRDPKMESQGVLEGMAAYRDAILKTTRAPIYDATCCPCLVIGTAGATLQIFAAYFADRIYRTHLCDFALDADADAHHDVAAVATKLRVIRNTARMLREGYARVHVGAYILPPTHTCRPHLLPRPTILMPVPAPLPVHLYLRDRVTRGQNSDVFTGTLTLSAHRGTDDSESSDRELPVHVKFVPEYSVAAHRLLATHTDASGAPRPLAPQLYWAGEIVPGLWMIVMETLPPDARMLYRVLAAGTPTRTARSSLRGAS
ncbi:hypothetical protein GSI_09896 [Ganoderma sinense ZZ0214-1]|uniref:Uncharacterized protein n=1 Tax=Ganoderma sinense ZZ0214-1 TaxID=1077348 RepID=A0A2G8S2P7_9APHY|nr:hypothetical protein GSI_09896 [Ganoderma sinense ZZ0214-1]